MTCTCYEAGRDPLCPVHGQTAGDIGSAAQRYRYNVSFSVDATKEEAEGLAVTVASAVDCRDTTPWPHELMHGELCATRFGMNATCDCGKGAESRV